MAAIDQNSSTGKRLDPAAQRGPGTEGTALKQTALLLRAAAKLHVCSLWTTCEGASQDHFKRGPTCRDAVSTPCSYPSDLLMIFAHLLQGLAFILPGNTCIFCQRMPSSCRSPSCAESQRAWGFCLGLERTGGIVI